MSLNNSLHSTVSLRGMSGLSLFFFQCEWHRLFRKKAAGNIGRAAVPASHRGPVTQSGRGPRKGGAGAEDLRQRCRRRYFHKKCFFPTLDLPISPSAPMSSGPVYLLAFIFVQPGGTRASDECASPPSCRRSISRGSFCPSAKVHDSDFPVL